MAIPRPARWGDRSVRRPHNPTCAHPDQGRSAGRDDEGDRDTNHDRDQGNVERGPSGPENGLDHDCAVALDNVVIVPVDLLGRTVGYLGAAQEVELARSVVLAHDLQVPLLD